MVIRARHPAKVCSTHDHVKLVHTPCNGPVPILMSLLVLVGRLVQLGQCKIFPARDVIDLRAVQSTTPDPDLPSSAHKVSYEKTSSRFRPSILCPLTTILFGIPDYRLACSMTVFRRCVPCICAHTKQRDGSVETPLGISVEVAVTSANILVMARYQSLRGQIRFQLLEKWVSS